MSKMGRILERAGLGRESPVHKIVIAIIGTTILLIGIAFLVLPGPAFIVIPIGLGVLASEFICARRVIEREGALMNRIKFRAKEPTR